MVAGTDLALFINENCLLTHDSVQRMYRSMNQELLQSIKRILAVVSEEVETLIVKPETTHDKDVKRVFRYITKRGSASRADLIRAFPEICSDRLDDVLTQLTNDEESMKAAGLSEWEINEDNMREVVGSWTEN